MRATVSRFSHSFLLRTPEPHGHVVFPTRESNSDLQYAPSYIFSASMSCCTSRSPPELLSYTILSSEEARCRRSWYRDERLHERRHLLLPRRLCQKRYREAMHRSPRSWASAPCSLATGARAWTLDSELLGRLGSEKIVEDEVSLDIGSESRFEFGLKKLFIFYFLFFIFIKGLKNCWRIQ